MPVVEGHCEDPRGCPCPGRSALPPARPCPTLPCLAARSPEPRFFEPPARPCPDPCPLPDPTRPLPPAPLPRPALSGRPFSVRTGSRFWNPIVRAGSRSQNPTVRAGSAASIKTWNRRRTHRQTHTTPWGGPSHHVLKSIISLGQFRAEKKKKKKNPPWGRPFPPCPEIHNKSWAV